jgi:outer membrane protein OmpA-like peptidoglycan-associated protein/phage baseplate assembly protein gpV
VPDDHLYSLLKQAHQVASTANAKIFGVEVAIVTNVQDPEKQGRVKICFPRMPGNPESDWARVVQPAAGAGRGFYWLPEVNDEVLVAFERGESSSPFVIGALWNGKDKPMDSAYTDDNSTRMLQTKSGHQLVFDDKSGQEKIVLADKSGKRTLTFDVANKKLLVEAAEGDIELHAEKKIVLECEDLEVKTSKTGKADIGTTFDVNIADKANMSAGPQMNLKASKVNINPSSSLAAQLASLAWKAARALAAAAAAGENSKAQDPASGAAGGGAAGGAAPAAAPGGAGGGDLSTDATPAAADAAPKAGAAGAEEGSDDESVGAGAGASPAATTTAAPAADAAADELDVQIVNVKGTPQKNLDVQLTLPSDGGQKSGKTGDDGHFKLESLTVTGNAKLDIPDLTQAPAGAASVQGRVRFVQGGVDVPIGKATVVEIPTRVHRARLRGMHFDTNKTFLLPSAMVGIRQLVKLYQNFDDITGLVNGHTDKQGAADYNRGLSEERAKAIKAFLLDDADTWMTWYGSSRFSASWGVREDQQMLTAVADSDGNPFLAQPFTDGTLDDATKAAVTKFQHSQLITETGQPSQETRRGLVESYMKLEGTSLDKSSNLQMHGCGLTHPLPETASDPNPDQPLNRRVEVFLFEGDIDPKAVQPCPSGGCAEYAKWVAQKITDVDLDQPPGHLQVQVVDSSDAAVAGAQVHIAGVISDDATTDDSGTADFADLIPGSYRISASKDDAAADDLTIDVPSVAPADDGSPGPATIAKVKFQGPLEVFLTVAWLDPDGKERTFPEGTPVTVVFGNGDKTELKLAADGLLNFTAIRSKKSFSLLFTLKDEKQYLAVAPDSDTTTKDAIVDESAIKDLIDKQFRVFLLPKALDQQFSDWKADGTLKHVFDKLDDPDAAVGTEDTPVKLVLDPRWQFVRLEFFDRFFGHTDHAHLRMPLPAVLLDGFGTDPGGTGKKDKADTRSNWVANAADVSKAAQAVPWILSKGADGKGASKPDAKSLFQLVTDAGSFVVSSTKDDRKIEVVTDAAQLKPSADRLKLYDLPPLWRSRKWFVRQAGAGAFFDKLTAAQIADSLTSAKPLVFSLDDLVLCDAQRKQVTLTATDRLAVFFHRFVSAPEAGSTSAVGVYKPDTGAKKSYFSEAAVATKAYLTDYPNWTRLVAAQGNLFEAFAERTADDAANDVVGARAAVRWVNSVSTGVAAGTAMANRPARVDHDFASIQPFYEQLYNQTNVQYSGAASATLDSIGRFDMTLLRCCDHDGDVEQALSLHFFRMFYTFDNTPPPAGKFPHPPASIYHSPAANFQANRSDYIENNCTNMAARWNGDDPLVHNTRAELIAKQPDDKIKATVVIFVQPAAAAASAHFGLKIVRQHAGTLGGRSWMDGNNGTGELDERASKPEGDYTPGSYTAAHELGHGHSLPDEYSERSSAFSNGELPFQMNTPGDIFETDSTNWDPGGPLGPDSGIMDGVQVMRNRYFWHSAEFAHTVTGLPFLVKCTQDGNVYDKYEVPPHELMTSESAPAAPKRSYIYWPIEDKLNDSAGGRSIYDLLLLTMGEDRFTKDIIAHPPIDGTLVMIVKLLVKLDATFAIKANRNKVLPALRKTIRDEYGDKFFASGDVRVGTSQAWKFERCMIRLQPRFLIQNLRPVAPADPTDFDDLLNMGAHFTININNVAVPNPRWQAASPNRTLVLEANAASPTLAQDLMLSFGDKFAEMLGFANSAAVTAASLKPYIQKLIGNGDVGAF